MVAGFSAVWYVSLFYIVAQVALGFHLYHGLWSLFQSLGWNHPRFNRWRSGFAQAFAWIVTLGNISFPLAVLTGWVHRLGDSGHARRSRRQGPSRSAGEQVGGAPRHLKLVNPNNKRKFTILVVGSGLAGGVGRGQLRPSSATT